MNAPIGVLDDLAGKVALVMLKEGDPRQKAGVPIANLQMATFEGHRWLIGTIVGEADYWVTGLVTALRFDNIFNILLFDSVEEYDRRVALAPEAPRVTDSEPERHN